MSEPQLPRLCYVADVPVESTQHGSALMFRLFSGYPAERLRIIETGLPSQPARRLRNVSYSHQQIGRRRWLDTRLHGVYSTWLNYSAPSRANGVIASLAGFSVEAFTTVAHGFGWLAASEAARRLGVPYHVIVHDDWPRLAAVPGRMRARLERTFARVYRAAATRLCVSPFMAEEYERRYGAAGSVLYPSRSEDGPVFEPTAARHIIAGDELVIGYGGNSGPEMMACLETLAAALPGSGARLVVYGPFDDGARQRLLAHAPSITFGGFLPFQDMIRSLRGADILFVPMTFSAADHDNQVVSFPSKLADYTATGMPLLIYGPPYSSAVRWARAEGDVAQVVDDPSITSLRSAIARLRDDSGRRTELARNAAAVGRRCFDLSRARAAFSTALLGGRA